MGGSAIDRLCNKVLNKVYYLRRRLTDIELERGIVSFTFDDFPASALHAGAPILEEAGWRGTYYVATGILGTQSACGLVASDEEVRDCAGRGHEIGNHSISHCDLTSVDSASVRREISGNRFDGMTGNLAYPFGGTNIGVQRLASHLTTTARGVSHGVNGAGTDRFNLLANPIYSADGTDALHRHIEEAARQRSWLIFYTHDVTDDPSPFGCTPEHLSEIVAAVAEAGMRVLTVEEARIACGLR